MHGPMSTDPVAPSGMRPLLATTGLSFAGFAALVSTVPLWVVAGGAGTAGAGLVNAVLLLFTVLAQALIPATLRRIGWSRTLIGGVLLLGGPSLLLPLSSALAPVLALSAVRGVGFAAITVCGSAAVARLVEPERRGRAVGSYGLAIALPQLLLLPSAVWVAENVGFWVVFVLGACPVLAVLPARRLGQVIDGQPASAPDPTSLGVRAMAATIGRIVPFVLLLTAATVAGGALITFAPQLTEAAIVSGSGLLLLTLTAALSRWRFGLLADRYGTRRLRWILVLLNVVGLLLVAWAVRSEAEPSSVLLLLGMAVVGVGYGGLQNLTLVDALATVPARQIDVASALWNIGFDAGTGLGSLLVGVLAAGFSFSTALVVTAAASLLTLPLAFVRTRTAAVSAHESRRDEL